MLVIYIFYGQIKKINVATLFDQRIKHLGALTFVIILLFFNLLFELIKWNNILAALSITRKAKIKFQSFFAGILTGFLTPNLLGNFIGRIFYFERRDRISITFLSLISNLSQFMASIFFGILSLILIGFPEDLKIQNGFIIYALLILILAILFICFFRVFMFGTKLFKFKSWYKTVLFQTKNKFNFLIKQLTNSILRHLIFSFQYFFILVAFGIEAQWILLFYIWQIFLWSTLIPSLWLGKLFIRESMAIWILSQLSNETEVILLSSMVLWLINQGFPALIGVPFIKFKKKNVY